MSCEETLRRLDDLLDGELRQEELEEVRSHLAGCASCREELARAERLRDMTAQLPRTVEPARDLWPRIEDRLLRTRPLPRPRRLPGPVLAAAAVVLVAVAAGMAYWAGRAQVPVRAAASAPRGDVTLAADTMPGLEAVQDDMLRARNDLRAAVAARRADLSPETRRVVDENLRLIDEAIARITAAFNDDPGNPELTRLLVAAYRQQINLLQRVAELPAAA